jgi:hypothetical protein
MTSWFSLVHQRDLQTETGISLVQKKLFLILVVGILGSGCYSVEKKYNYGESFHNSPDIWTEEEPQFESGKPNWILDNLGDYFFSIPAKLILWNRNVGNHQISDTTKDWLKGYIRENNLRSVKVRFNQYAPGSELRRIWKNDTIHPFVKYSAGLISWVVYSVLPERLFAGLIGGDHYNPFSNTINLYSDIPAIAIHEGGHAKDFSQRERKTLYAILYSVPIFGSLYHEAVASDDTLSYFAEKKDDDQIEESFEILIPAYSTYMGGSINGVVSSPFTVVAVIPGHAYGQYKSREYRNLRNRRRNSGR